MGIFNKGAGILAPIIFAAVDLKSWRILNFNQPGKPWEAARKNAVLDERLEEGQLLPMPFRRTVGELGNSGTFPLQRLIPDMQVRELASKFSKKLIYNSPHFDLEPSLFSTCRAPKWLPSTTSWFVMPYHLERVNLGSLKYFHQFTLAFTITGIWSDSLIPKKWFPRSIFF